MEKPKISFQISGEIKNIKLYDLEKDSSACCEMIIFDAKKDKNIVYYKA